VRRRLGRSDVNYAFLIDNRKCIGCHACSTACKSENEVPLGVNRTWVKYVEKGEFPDTRRYFQVTRCNHCAKPPCVPICPTKAMYRRDDGIVEFDSNLCIGCKACMQACPYDAIFIDPDSGTAAKCHFCAHRTDVGLEPACVVVCPVHAIIAGDMGDRNSEISRLLATHDVRVRKPEQNTRPKLFYIDADESTLLPMAAAQDSGMSSAQWPGQGGDDGNGGSVGDWRGPIQIAPGKMAGALLRSGERETYNVPHRVPWHWQVPAYLVTKSIGAGAFLVAVAGVALGLLPALPLFTTVASLLALVFIAITTGLLVWDLDRPERFWTILLRPQWRSWLTRGAVVLIAFVAASGLYWLAHALDRPDLARYLAWPGVLLAILSAVYTAFLFAQAEGRDLWQSRLLSGHLFVQAARAGAAALAIGGLLAGVPAEAARVLSWTLGGSLLVDLLLTAGEFAVPHSSTPAAAAAALITRGRYAPHFWGSVAGGLVLPLLLIVLGGGSLPAVALAGALSLAGLFVYEWAFVMAPQQVPNN
jgi:Fe-S-cluster-containing dehydrogenase component/formate-dependent nitrite reductase membrane component NrfD